MRRKTLGEERSVAFRVLYYWGKFLGINPLVLTKNNVLEFSYFSLVYGCFLGTIYCVPFYFAFMDRFRYYTPGETQFAVLINFIGVCAQFVEVLSTFFTFAIYQTRISCLAKSFAKAEKTSIPLGIPEDYKSHCKTFGINLAVNNVMYLASLAFSTSMQMFLPTFKPAVWLCYNIPRLVSFNVGIVFVGSLLLTKRKFRQLNERVKGLLENNYSNMSKIQETRKSGLIRNSSCNPATFSNRIDMVARLHSELRNVVHRIEEHFALVVLSSVVNYVLSFANAVFIICQRLRDRSQLTGTELIVRIGGSSHWFICPVIMLIELATVCSSTSDEANNTGNCLHGILNNYETLMDTREFAKVNRLSLDLLKNHVSISLYGLIQLDNSFIHKAFATGVTYFTILLQF